MSYETDMLEIYEVAFRQMHMFLGQFNYTLSSQMDDLMRNLETNKKEAIRLSNEEMLMGNGPVSSMFKKLQLVKLDGYRCPHPINFFKLFNQDIEKASMTSFYSLIREHLDTSLTIFSSEGGYFKIDPANYSDYDEALPINANSTGFYRYYKNCGYKLTIVCYLPEKYNSLLIINPGNNEDFLILKTYIPLEDVYIYHDQISIVAKEDIEKALIDCLVNYGYDVPEPVPMDKVIDLLYSKENNDAVSFKFQDYYLFKANYITKDNGLDNYWLVRVELLQGHRDYNYSAFTTTSEWSALSPTKQNQIYEELRKKIESINIT